MHFWILSKMLSTIRGLPSLIFDCFLGMFNFVLGVVGAVQVTDAHKVFLLGGRQQSLENTAYGILRLLRCQCRYARARVGTGLVGDVDSAPQCHRGLRRQEICRLALRWRGQGSGLAVVVLAPKDERPNDGRGGGAPEGRPIASD